LAGVAALRDDAVLRSDETGTGGATVESTDGARPTPVGLDEGCTHLGAVDSVSRFELRFTDTVETAGAISVIYELIGGGVEGPDIAFVERGVPGDHYRIEHGLPFALPGSLAEPDALSCRILTVENAALPEPSATTELAGCALIEFDIFDRAQILLALAGKFPEGTPLSVRYALLGAGRVPFATGTSNFEVFGAGTSITVEVDTETGLPDGMSRTDFTCQVLGVD
jgi:hypothetical protein